MAKYIYATLLIGALIGTAQAADFGVQPTDSQAVILADSESVWDKTKGVASDTWDGTKEVSGDVWDGTKKVTSDVWDGTKEVASDVKDGLTDDTSTPPAHPHHHKTK